jgi:hypothetical protein
MTILGTGGGDGFTLSGRLTQGAESDGLGLGTDYVEIVLGGQTFTLPVSGFTFQGGTTWSFSGTGPVTSGTFTKNGNSVDMSSVTGSGTNVAYPGGPTTIQLRIGDDTGSVNVPMRGTLLYP